MDDERSPGAADEEVSKFPEEFPSEIKRQVISFLTNDATTLIRFALCSKGWYDHILRHETAIYPNLWKELVYRRWRRIHRYSRRRRSINRSRNEFEVWSSFRQMYKEKHQIDTDAIHQLKQMTTDLQIVLELNESDYLNESDTHIGQGWNHRCWHTLLRDRIDNYDILKTMAKRYLPSPSPPAVTTSTTNNTTINANGSSSSSSSSLLSTSSVSTYDRLFGFLAACCIQNFHFADCLWQWKRLEENQNGNINNDDNNDDDDLNTARLLEHYALLICQIQKTPLELLDDEEDDNPSNAASRNDDDNNNVDNNNDNNSDNFDANYMSIMNSRATTYMDEIANVCRERISYELEENNNNNNNNNNVTSSSSSSSSLSLSSSSVTSTTITTTAKLKVINKVLVDQYGFSGNSTDYYNYQNVLLDHVLVSKTGMPLTLCVVYSCICRRLDIHVSVTGLPGHIVLGFDDNDNDTRSDVEIGSSRRRRRSFMDVFNGGTILSVVDCQEIVEGYGVEWNDKYLTPLPLKSTLQRILNNLTNCHAQATTRRNTNPGPFHPDLMFQQRALGLIYRHPPEIVSSMLERFTQDLHIVLSPDLLRSYHLIPPRGIGIDPVVNATHARVLLELMSTTR
jgi:regulator of sirC expression with transglutaminase-like and TPR domain